MLTDAKIKGIKPAITKKRYTDGLNLSLIVEPKGRKYFEIRYKSPVTKTIRSYSAGTYPYVSLQDARKKAMEIKEAVANGIDIKDKEKTFKFRDIAIEYLNLKNGRVTQKHLNRCLRCMENYMYPTLGNMDIKDITANMLITSLKPLEQNEKLDTLHRALSIAKEIFRYAHMRGYIHTNQIADISANTVFKTYKQKNYPSLTNLDDLKGLIASIQAYNGDIKTKVALKLSLLTANRPYNIRAAKWQEIDLENEIWTIPAEKMKGKIEHILPLSKQVVELLKEYRKIDFGSEFLFPSQLSKTRPMSDNTINSALRRMGYSKDELVAHGFRAMFSTFCYEYQHEHKITGETIEQCLAHKTGSKVKSAYDRSLRLEQKRILMQWWADFLENLTK